MTNYCNNSDINGLLATLMEKKARMEADERQVETEVLLDFLQRTREQKQAVCLDDLAY